MADPYWDKVRQDAEKNRAERAGLGKKPKTVGKRKYLCAECKHEGFEHWTTAIRAARMRCPGCGSLKYEMKSAEARADAIDLKDFRKDFDGEKGTGGQSFVIGS